MFAKRNLLKLRGLLFLTLTLPVFFSSLLSGDSLFLFRDLFLFHYPLRYYWITELLGGTLPMMNVALNGGQPIPTNPNYGIYYPGNILYFLFPFDLAWNLSLAGHILWAAIGFYWFSKKIGCTETGALSGAVCFAFSGPVLSSLNYYNLLLTLSWIPWILGFVYNALMGSRRWAAAAILALSAQFFAGEPTVQLGTAFLVTIVIIVLLRNKITRKTAAQTAALIIIGTILFCAVQWIPTMLWLPQTSRASGLDFRQSAAYWSLHPGRLVELLAPDYYGSPMSAYASDFWGGILSDEGYPYFPRIYAGWLPLLLIPLAWKRRWGKTVVMLTLLTAAFSLGHYLPGYRFFYDYFPPLRIVRYPEKFTAFLAIGLSFITAFGVSQLRKEGSRSTPYQFLSLLLVCAGLYFLTFPENLSAEQNVLQKEAVADAMLWGAISFALILLLTGRQTVQPIFVAFPLILFLDLFFHTSDVPQTLPVALVREEPEVLQKAEELRQQAVYHLGERQSELYFLGGLSPEIFFQKATHPLIGIKWGITYGLTTDIDRMGWRNRQQHFHDLERDFPDTGSIRLLRESGIEWIVSLRPLSAPDLRFHKKIELPGYRFLYLYRPVLNSFSLVRWNPGAGELKWLSVSPHRMLIHATTQTGGSLTVLRNAFPGWKVMINGRPVSLSSSGDGWLHIPLSPGRHEIELSFQPPGLRIGAILTSLGSLIILSLLIL